MNTNFPVNILGNNKKIYRTIKGRIFNRPQNLGEGLQRVVNYASKKHNPSPYKASLLNVQTIGNDIDAVQTRTYTNGVAFFQNKKGLFIFGPNDFSLIFNDLKKRLLCSQPIAATLRKTENVCNTVIKFMNNLNNTKEYLYIKDYGGKVTRLKTTITKNDYGYGEMIGELSFNQNTMLKTISENK